MASGGRTPPPPPPCVVEGDAKWPVPARVKRRNQNQTKSEINEDSVEIIHEGLSAISYNNNPKMANNNSRCLYNLT